jgi:serine/alanine adding enzyme
MLVKHKIPEFDTAPPVHASTDVSREEWDAYVAARPDATGYHAWRWRAVFEQAFGHETRYLAARREGEIVGILPLVLFHSVLFGRFMVSLPFVNYGGVVADDAMAADALLAEAERIGRAGGFSHLELRHQRRQFDHLAVREHKVSMLLQLPRTADAAWAAMDRKVRNQIRKAEKSGLTAIIGGAERLDEFYRIFATNMRDLGTPVYAKTFFEHVLRAYGDDARIVVVLKDGIAVAAGIALAAGDVIEVPWASSLGEFRALCPNHMLYWSVIQWAIEQRFEVLDFGRSTPNEGTFQFKRQWGAEPLPLRWEYRLFRGVTLPDQSPKNPKFRIAIDLWKRCPLWLTNRLGPHIVRSIP